MAVEFFDQSFIEGEIQVFDEEKARSIVDAHFYEIIRGDKVGRNNDDEITVFDSVGIALEDLSALSVIHTLSEKYNIGEIYEMIPDIKDPKKFIWLIGGVMIKKEIFYIGAEFGAGAGTIGCEKAPCVISDNIPQVKNKMATMITMDNSKRRKECVDNLAESCENLARAVYEQKQKNHFPIVIGATIHQVLELGRVQQKTKAITGCCGLTHILIYIHLKHLIHLIRTECPLPV